MMKINFKKSTSAKNDIPRIVGGKLCFGHWDRHGKIVGQEKHKPDDYVQIDRGMWATFSDISGQPRLKVESMSGRRYARHQPPMYAKAVFKIDGQLITIDAPNTIAAEVPESEWNDADRQHQAKHIKESRKNQEHYEKWQEERDATHEAKVAAMKTYEPTRQERKWLKRFVQSGGRKSQQQVEDFLKEKFEVSYYSVEDVKEYFG